MQLEQEFEVAAPIDRVWEALIDIERVAPNLPGAAVTGRNDDGSYNGTFSVKIGPTSASYTGKLEMEQVDADSHVAVMQANGTDKRGQGGAKATIKSSLSEANGGTRVSVVTDYHITGRLARFGRGGMIEDISEKLLKQFAASLQQSLAGPGAPESAAEPAAGASTGTPDEPSQSPWAPPDTGPADNGNDWSPPTPAPPPPGSAAAMETGQATSPFPPTTPAEPLRADAIVASVLADRAKANPLPLLAALLAVFLFVRRRRRR